MIRFITFCDSSMTISAQHCVDSAKMYGAETCQIYSPDDIDSEFYDEHHHILDHDLGAGLWLWKPYIILKELHSLVEGDILIYCDAGVKIINDLTLLINDMKKDIMLFESSESHIARCKDSVLDYFSITDDIKQLQASVIIIKVTTESKQFISEWLYYCCDYDFIYDKTNFHKHDQALLTCVATKYDVQRVWWCTDYKIVPGDCYIMFKHHRKRNNEYK